MRNNKAIFSFNLKEKYFTYKSWELFFGCGKMKTSRPVLIGTSLSASFLLDKKFGLQKFLKLIYKIAVSLEYLYKYLKTREDSLQIFSQNLFQPWREKNKPITIFQGLNSTEGMCSCRWTLKVWVLTFSNFEWSIFSVSRSKSLFKTSLTYIKINGSWSCLIFSLKF